MSGYLRSIPTRVVLEPYAALIGSVPLPEGLRP
jgi:glucokinase